MFNYPAINKRNLIYVDNFSGYAIGTPLTNTIPGWLLHVTVPATDTATVKNNVSWSQIAAFVTNVGADNGAALTWYPVSYNNFTFSGRISIEGSSKACEIFFRSSGTMPALQGFIQFGYYINIIPVGGNIIITLTVERADNTSTTLFTSGSFAAVITDMTFSVICEGSNIQFFVNGVQRVNVTDINWASGFCGFLADVQTDLYFTNISIKPT